MQLQLQVTCVIGTRTSVREDTRLLRVSNDRPGRTSQLPQESEVRVVLSAIHPFPHGLPLFYRTNYVWVSALRNIPEAPEHPQTAVALYHSDKANHGHAVLTYCRSSRRTLAF